METSKYKSASAFAKGEKKIGRLGLADLARLSLRIFKTKPTRMLLTVLGMSLGVGVVLFLISLGYGLQYLLIGRLVTTEDSLVTLNGYYPTDSNVAIQQKDIDHIKELPGFQEVSAIAEFPAEIKISGSQGSGSGYLLARIVPFNYERLSGISPDLKTKGSSFEDNIRNAVVSSAALKTLGLPADETTLGKEVKLNVLYPGDEEGTVRPVAPTGDLIIQGIITDEAQPPFITLSQKVLGDNLPPYYQGVFVKGKDIDTIEPLRADLIKMGLLVSSRIDMVNQVKKIMSIVTIILGVFGITALVVSAIGMFNTMLISFLERIYEVGIMKALGATNRDIRNLFLAESFLMGLMGGVGGILLGTGMGDVANFGMNMLAKSFGGKPIELFIRPWWFIAIVMFLSVVIGVFSGFWPARRATLVSPEEAFVRK